MTVDQLLGYLLGSNARGEDALHCSSDLLATAIVERDIQDQAGVSGSQLDGRPHPIGEAWLNTFEGADVADLDVVAM